MSQANYAELERRGQGSAYTPKIARRCGVSVDWLAYASGEMLSQPNQAGSRIEAYGAHLMGLLAAMPEHIREANFLAASQQFVDAIAHSAKHQQQPLDPLSKSAK